MSKTTEEAEIDALRKYIVACPDVPKESRAIHAALQGLDTEVKRMERDTKLKRKFASSQAETASKAETKMENQKLDTKSAAVGASTTSGTSENSSNATNSNTPASDDELMEWQDVATNKEAGSLLGSRVAQLAVANMAQHGTTVKTPLAAISLALHAALSTDVLGFRCTGIPEAKTFKGFAPPIRELPKTQFVPPKWDDDTNEIRLRYRKAAVGSVALSCVLRQSSDNDNQVQVSVTPTKTNEPPSELLEFKMDDHVNLASFQKALAKEGSVLPALHYKALATLLTNFVNTFDLGSIGEAESTAPDKKSLPYADPNVICIVPPHPSMMQPGNDPLRMPSRRPVPPAGERNPYGEYNPHENPSIQVFQPNRGDFAGDLHPPGRPDFLGGGGGNLMGPDHPMFNGGRAGIGGGGFGMRPRFDPMGPPGGPQDPNNPSNLQQPLRRRPPPGGLGEPNPDHARPPNNLNNNMFM